MNKVSQASGGISTTATVKPIKNRKAFPKVGIKGYASCTIHRVDGTTEYIPARPNVIPQAGFSWLADSLYDGTEPAGQARWLGLSTTNITSPMRDPNDNFTVVDLTSPDGVKRKETRTSDYNNSNRTMVLDQIFTNATVDTGTRITGIRTLTLYTAETGGTLIHAVDTATFALNAGDSVEVDWTITLSEPA